MNKLAVVLAIAIVVGAGASVSTSTPLANIAFEDNSGGWFTTENLQAYGDDLDQRIDGDEPRPVFTGHPAYVMESDDARLLFDRPRMFYYTTTLNGTAMGERFADRLASALRDGRAPYAINNTMTHHIVTRDDDVTRAFRTHYCRVPTAETGGLYAGSGSTLYRWVPNGSVCPPSRRPDSDWERPSP